MKNKCKIGLSCGATCIEETDKCLKKVSKENSDKLNYTVTKYLRPKDHSTNVFTSKIQLANSDTKGAVKISKSFLNPSFYQLDFEVNESYNVDRTLSRRDSIAIGKAVRTEMLALIDKAPEGTVFTAVPHYGDGKREQRVKAYKRAGFSDLDVTTEHMFAIKKEGKLTPYKYVADAGFNIWGEDDGIDYGALTE